MPDRPLDNSTRFLPLKIFLVSLAVLGLNVLIYFFLFSSDQTAFFRDVSPRLIFADSQEVSLKGIFDSEFKSATVNQTVLSGTTLRTGANSFAEMQVEGSSIRLGENTEVDLLQNNFNNIEEPRFVLSLKSGTIWVNATQFIQVYLPRSEVFFSHSMGSVTLKGSLNTIRTVTGYADVKLYTPDSSRRTSFILPLRSQIVYSDDQLVADYSRIQYSKLKKELKLSAVPKILFEEPWVKRNLKNDESLLKPPFTLESASAFEFLTRYHTLRAQFALVPFRQRLEQLKLAVVDLKYLLGRLNISGDIPATESLLAEFDQLAQQFYDDSDFSDMLVDYFYRIRSVERDTAAFKVKEYLRSFIFTYEKDPVLLRTYFADIDYLLTAGRPNQAELVAHDWFDRWGVSLRNANKTEFENQSRLFLNVLKYHSDNVTKELLSILDQLGDIRLSMTTRYEDTLLEIASDRLDMSKLLVAAARFTEAKTYLKTSYSNLKLSEQNVPLAARDLFIKEATLIGDRIAFAEEQLKGAAGSVDESKFNDYLAIQERDKTLAERFETLISGSKLPEEEPIVYPTVPEVADHFAKYGIVAIPSDILVVKDHPFEFTIKEARIPDIYIDGKTAVFSGTFDFVTDVMIKVILNGQSIAGTISMKDLIKVATVGTSKVPVENVPTPDVEGASEYLSTKSSDEVQRNQLIAQDLAMQLAMAELNQQFVTLPSTGKITILNTSTLNEFRLKDAFIEDPTTGRKTQLSFDYFSDTQMVSKVEVVESPQLSLPATIQLSQLSDLIFSQLYGLEEVQAETEKVKTELSSLGLTVRNNDLKFRMNTDLNLVDFKTARLKEMPIDISGTFNRSAKTLTSAAYESFTMTKVPVRDFLRAVAEQWLIKYLDDQGIPIAKTNITTTLPASRVTITGYKRGAKEIDFIFDVTSNRLLDIRLKGLANVVSSMTFEEFSLIQSDEVIVPGTTPQEAIVVEETVDPLIKQIGSCGQFVTKLSTCTAYTCEFYHPLTNKPMVRRITGLLDGKCRYSEGMPDGELFSCSLPDSYRIAFLTFYKDLLDLGVMLTESTADKGSADASYVIDEIQTSNPYQTAIENTVCEVVGGS